MRDNGQLPPKHFQMKSTSLKKSSHISTLAETILGSTGTDTSTAILASDGHSHPGTPANLHSAHGSSSGDAGEVFADLIELPSDTVCPHVPSEIHRILTYKLRYIFMWKHQCNRMI